MKTSPATTATTSIPSPCSPAATNDEPLFSTVRSALAFAYTIEGQPIANSPHYGPPPGGRPGRLTGLTAHEKHAQGAFIRRAVEQRLNPLELALTWAAFGQGAIRARAMREVARQFAPLVRRAGLGRELVYRYFTPEAGRRTQQQLADEFGISNQAVSKLDRRIAGAIEDARIATERVLETLFVRTGVAERV